LVGRLEAVASTPHGGDEGGLAPAVKLVPEVGYVDIHHVGARIKGIVPHCRENLLAAQDLSLVAHKVLKQRKLPAGELDRLLPPPHPVRAQIQLEVPKLYPGSLGLVGAAHQSAHPGKQLLEVEGFGEVVVGATVEGAYLITHLVAGCEHENGEVGTPRPDAPQDLLAVHAWQHYVEQDEVNRLVLGHQHSGVAVICGESLVAVSSEPALEEAHDGGVVFDDQDAHGIRQYNRAILGRGAG
jgi:hypothetical protein